MTLKKNALLFFLLLNINFLFAQMVNPVTWSYQSKKISDSEYLLISKATIKPGWHLYSQFFEDGGPIRLTFDYKQSNDFKLIGKTKESPAPTKEHDEIFNINVAFFSNTATFSQKIKVLSSKDFKVDLIIEGQACMEDGMCVPIDGEHKFSIKGVPAQKGKKAEVTKNQIKTKKDTTKTSQKTSKKQIIESSDTLKKETLKIDKNAAKLDKTKVKKATKKDETKSLWTFFFVAFFAGLITLLTPCVFPIVPMTVSFFMHNNKEKGKANIQALFYGISIVAIYTVPILILNILTAFFGANFIEADFANTMATHWFFNILFTIIFLTFAASFFGLFEITLPSWMIDKTDEKADKGGWIGIFFMAFTLVLVSFSCTGPIVGTIIVQSLTGLQVQGGVAYSFGELLLQYGEPTVGMLGFSIGVALPFTLFALFPSWLKNLPKSGGWLNSVKIILGFLELALALKFLSVSDQAYHWGLLDREVYLSLWITIFSLMGFYLLGKLKFHGDSDIKEVSVTRLILSIITFSFVVYMIPGLWGAPLKGLSGYLPPQTSQDFDIERLIEEGGNNIADFSKQSSICETPKYSETLHLPHGIKGYFDYKQGMACAKKLGKPVFLDFTGHGCVNCRKMEEKVWSNPDVLKRLKKDYVVISLYVDDKTELPKNEWIKSSYDGKLKKTIGKKYADFQISKFGINAQPYYVLLDNDGHLLNKAHAFDTDINNFVQFLDKGLKNYKK